MNDPQPLPAATDETQAMSRARDSFIGHYRVEVKIGDGGMGVVYKCEDPKLRRFVAVKVLKEKHAGDRQYTERLEREARAVAALSHPNVAQIFAIEESDGGPPCLVMEYVDGPSAEALLRAQGALEPARALETIRQAAAGLKAALEKGIIHRDVKPSNILIAPDGRVKIVDFGLARVIEEARPPALGPAEGKAPITDEGIVLGTPQYISPEQARGQKADQRSDIYSLGATFYHLLTGRPPFGGESQAGVIVAHLNETPEPPHRVRPGVPEAMSLVIGKMLAKDPARRYPGYGELLDDLDRLARGQALGPGTAAEGAATFRRPVPRVPARFFWAAAGAVALAVAATLLVRSFLDGGSAGVTWPKPLSQWYGKKGGTECLNLSFADLPEGMTRPEIVQALFLFDRRDAERASIDPAGAGLVLRNLAAPAALRFGFRGLERVSLLGLRLGGPVDFGIALVHPRGARLRKLVFALRPGRGAAAGEAKAGQVAEPVWAERHGERVEIEPRPAPAPLLRSGPGDLHDVEIRLSPEGNSTRVQFQVRRAGSSADPVYRAGGPDGVLLPGADWPAGVLLLWPASSLGGSSASIAAMAAVGALDHDNPVASPWEVEEVVARPKGGAAHGQADRR